VVDTQLPFTLGTGGSSLDEITSALEFLQTAGGEERVILMHGVQNFPTSIDDLNIARVQMLQHLYNKPVGYHDHTDASLPFSRYVDLIAIGFGVVLVEKHITLDRSKKEVDYQAALEPDEFKEFVKTIQLAQRAVGVREPKALSKSDLQYREFQKKSIVAISDLKAGEILRREDVKFLRNVHNGLSPERFKEMEGKRIKRNIGKFTNIVFEDLQ